MKVVQCLKLNIYHQKKIVVDSGCNSVSDLEESMYIVSAFELNGYHS